MSAKLSLRWAERARLVLLLIVLLGTAAIAIQVARPLYDSYLANARLPLWDMAGHGYGGVELLQALKHGRFLFFLDLLNRQDKWPFGYSLLLLPFLALGKSTFASATLLSATLFALTPPLLVWAGREVDPRSGPWGGLVAAGLFLASPLERVLAVVVMRELAGVVFTLLALGLYLRARRLSTLWSWRLAGLASLALFLIKVNYALIWAVCVAGHELLVLPPDRRREVFGRVRRLLWPWPGASRGRIALAVVLDLLLLCAIAGVNPGVGVYALLLIGAGVAAFFWLKDRERIRAWWRALPMRRRALLETVILPLWLWCLSPDPIHPKNFYAFLHNRAEGPSLFSLESLTFYGRSLMNDYAPAVWVGGLVILFAVLSLCQGGHKDRPYGPLALLAILGWLLATVHPYKEPRFFATTVPFIFLLAGIGLVRIVQRWQVVTALAGAGLFFALILIAQGEPLARRLVQDYLLYSGDPRYADVLEVVQRKAAGRKNVAVIGTFNQFSDSLVRWSMAQKGIELVPPLARTKPAHVGKHLEEWVREEQPRRILAIRLLPRSPLFQAGDFQLYNAWQLDVLRALQNDPRWSMTRRKRFRWLDLELQVLDRRTSPPSPLSHRTPTHPGEGERR